MKVLKEDENERKKSILKKIAIQKTGINLN
jgi:hypothetical protein